MEKSGKLEFFPTECSRSDIVLALRKKKLDLGVIFFTKWKTQIFLKTRSCQQQHTEQK